MASRYALASRGVQSIGSVAAFACMGNRFRTSPMRCEGTEVFPANNIISGWLTKLKKRYGAAKGTISSTLRRSFTTLFSICLTCLALALICQRRMPPSRPRPIRPKRRRPSRPRKRRLFNNGRFRSSLPGRLSLSFAHDRRSTVCDKKLHRSDCCRRVDIGTRKARPSRELDKALRPSGRWLAFYAYG